MRERARGGREGGRERRWPKGDSVYFTIPAALESADWRGGRPIPGSVIPRGERTEGGGMAAAGRRGKGECGWGKIAGLPDAGVFCRYRRAALFYRVAALSFSRSSTFAPRYADLPLSHSRTHSPPPRFIPSGRGTESILHRYAVVAASVDLLICEPATT